MYKLRYAGTCGRFRMRRSIEVGYRILKWWYLRLVIWPGKRSSYGDGTIYVKFYLVLLKGLEPSIFLCLLD